MIQSVHAPVARSPCVGKGYECLACHLPSACWTPEKRRPHHPRAKIRGLWVKVKCQNREEFVVVGWTDPEASRPWFGALLLAYYDLDGRLVHAGRVGTGIGHADRLWRRLQSLATAEMPGSA